MASIKFSTLQSDRLKEGKKKRKHIPRLLPPPEAHRNFSFEFPVVVPLSSLQNRQMIESSALASSLALESFLSSWDTMTARDSDFLQ